MNYIKIIPETISDGEGLRAAIYLAGCENRCEGCFNSESWDYKAGRELTDNIIDQFIIDVLENTLVEGVSILGGDPFAPKNRKDLYHLLRKLRDGGINNIWVWTGYTKEELEKDPIARACFSLINVLVDGPFMVGLRDIKLKYRGSTNQRIIRLNHSDTTYANPEASISL